MKNSARFVVVLTAVLVAGGCFIAVANAAPSLQTTAAQSPPTINLAGYSFEEAYSSGSNAGGTFSETYTANTATYKALSGPFAGSVVKNVSYLALSLGHNRVEILATFPSGLTPSSVDGLEDVITFDLTTHTVVSASTIPGQFPWAPDSGTMRVLKKGEHPIA